MLSVHFLQIPTCNAVELNDDEECKEYLIRFSFEISLFLIYIMVLVILFSSINLKE